MSKAEPSRRATLSVTEVVTTYHTLRAVEAELAKQDLTAFLVTLLAGFEAHPGEGIGIVARRLGITSPAATNGVDRLEARGLVRRIGRHAPGSARDRRLIVVEVTEQGQAMLAALVTIEVER